MIHDIKLNINLEINGLSDEMFERVVKIMNTEYRISFEDINKYFVISSRPYNMVSISFPELNYDSNNELSIKTTEINIVG